MVSTAYRAGPFGVVVRLVLAVLRSRCAGFARPSLPRRLDVGGYGKVRGTKRPGTRRKIALRAP